MIPLGHIAGIPVEETALSFGPVLLAGGGIAALKVRDRVARLRARVASRGESRRSPAR
jgi:tRNA G37 N-methylase TrmD